MVSENKKNERLLTEIKLRRKEWKDTRKKRLYLKEQLFSSGFAIQKIRKDKNYRRLKKNQHRLSICLKHLLKKYNKF